MPNAIVSVYDKTGLDYLGSLLKQHKFTVFSTPGTRRALKSLGYDSQPVELITGNPDGYNDLVSSFGFKTMVAALEGNRNRLIRDGIYPIDLVVYNFVPSWKFVSSLDQFNIKNVDFGGPAIIKAAALNFRNVIPLVLPLQYSLLEDYPDIDFQTRCDLAQVALRSCYEYDKRLVELLHTLSLTDTASMQCSCDGI